MTDTYRTWMIGLFLALVAWRLVVPGKIVPDGQLVVSVFVKFVNMLAGPIDMNNGEFDLRRGQTTRVDNKMEVPSTLVSEAARTLIAFSGTTIIPDAPEYYQKYSDLLRFLAMQEQPGRKSKPLAGVISQYIVMGRQAAEGRWLVGAATDEQGRTLNLPFSFFRFGLLAGTLAVSVQSADMEGGDRLEYDINNCTLKLPKQP